MKKIVVEHGGSILAADGPLGGARITITLPLAAAEDESSARALAEVPSALPAPDPASPGFRTS